MREHGQNQLVLFFQAFLAFVVGKDVVFKLSFLPLFQIVNKKTAVSLSDCIVACHVHPSAKVMVQFNGAFLPCPALFAALQRTKQASICDFRYT